MAAMTALISLSAGLIGCASDQGAPPDAAPGQTAQKAAQNIDQRIAAIKNDPKIPATSKQAAIAGMERAKAMAAEAGRAPSRRPAPASGQ